MQHFAPIDRAGRNSHLLGYHFNPNDYFLMADFRGFPADLGDLGYWLCSYWRNVKFITYMVCNVLR